MKSKGQAINIDWTVGMSLFLLTALSSVLVVSQPDAIGLKEKAMDNKLLDISSNLEEATFVEGRRTTLHTNSPVDLNRKIPLDRTYYFGNISSDGSGRMDTLSDVDLSENNVRAVLEMENSTHKMTYLDGKLSETEQSTDLETGSEISNSLISVDPGSPGLTSFQINGKELLNSDADFRFTDYSINEEKISASTFGGNLTVYSNTSEFIVEDTGTATFNVENLTTLYWYADNSTTQLEGSVSKSGDTKGLTIASDYGITFLGDLNADVTKQSGSDTVKVQIDAGRLRVMAHDSDYVEGWRRIKTYDKGEIYFGAAEKIEGATKKKIQNLDKTSELGFERRLKLGNLGYNISYGIPGTIDQTAYNIMQSVSDQIDWNRGKSSGSSADRKDNSGTLGIGYRNGTAETELTEGLVGYWRMDRNIAGNGGTVKDYSVNSKNGTTNGGIKTGQTGVFGTNASEFDGSDDYIDISQGRLEKPATVSAWLYVSESASEAGQTNINLLEGSKYSIRVEQFDKTGKYGFTEYGVSDYTFSTDTVYNEWAHVSWVFNQSQSILYVNGEQRDVHSETIGVPLGKMVSQSGGRFYNGSIDEVRVYNRSLSESEIQRLYFNGRDGEFVSNYSGNRVGGDEERNWTSVEINASVPSQTNLSAEVEVYNEFGNDLGDQLIDVIDGSKNYTLNVREAERLQLNFNGTSTNVTKSWEIYDFKVYTGSAIQRSIIKRGSRLPTRNTFVRDSKPSLIRDNGSLGTIESRVILWE